MKRITMLWPILVVFGVLALTTAASRTPVKPLVPDASGAAIQDLDVAIAGANTELARLWEELGIEPAQPADELTIFRRLSLALHGTIPSLEEIRLFEGDPRPDRLRHWTASMLGDNRFADYFAERLARGFVGVEQGQFLIFRRDRFTDWLRKQLRNHTPYDEIVRNMIQSEGVWTGRGEVNFITSAFANDEFDANKLTARTVRAFLGQRMDCAQCHDHPYDHWKQTEFEGLAAHYGQVQLTLAGLVDDAEKDFVIQDAETLDDRTIPPQVPFNPEWIGDAKGRRAKLANWVTHPENRRFERAVVNRVWGLMFGKPFASDRPVDDLPDPDTNEALALLDRLGADFRTHDCDLRRLVQVIAGSRAFRMDSIHPLDAELEAQDIMSERRDAVGEELQSVRDHWAVFPLIRLRPEQVIGAMLQSHHLHTIDQNSHLIVRFLRFIREQDFVDEFGDPGVDELQDRAGTIPQALLRMNGQFARELTEVNPFFAPGRIMGVAGTPERLLETCYLVCLTRRPTEAERGYFLPLLEEKQKRDQMTQDLFWTLFNSPEFSWNH